MVQPGDAGVLELGHLWHRWLPHSLSLCFCEDDGGALALGLLVYAVFHLAKLVLNVVLAEHDLELFYLCAYVGHRLKVNPKCSSDATKLFLSNFFFSRQCLRKIRLVPN